MLPTINNEEFKNFALNPPPPPPLPPPPLSLTAKFIIIRLNGKIRCCSGFREK